MIDQNQKQFAVYVLAQVFPMVSRLIGGDQTQFLTNLSTVIPGIDANAIRSTQGDQWANQIATVVVDHYEEQYDPKKFRASA